MAEYFMQFRVMGEVADILFLQEPEARLLVDISTDSGQGTNHRPYPSRTCFSIFEPELIDAFKSRIKVGDVVAANGTFSQGSYVPHKTTCIDTTFLMLGFEKLCQDQAQLTHNGKVLELPAKSSLH